jgi:hypothetical protein
MQSEVVSSNVDPFLFEPVALAPAINTMDPISCHGIFCSGMCGTCSFCSAASPDGALDEGKTTVS